jgi:hemerythrin-like metal-binding protein
MYRAKQGGRNRSESDPQTAFGTDGGRRVPQSLLQLVWRDSYRCGDHGIDEQHRRLFEHANRLLDAVLASAARERVLVATRDLIGEITAHFRDEERLHADIGYPDRDGHAAEHLSLLRKAERLAAMAERDALPAADLFQFLAYEVIAQHLLGTDRRYYPYLGAAAAADGPPAA